MTTAQIDEAIEQAKTSCKIWEETDYHSVSMRGTLSKLGYSTAEIEAVLEDIAARGFNYCLDPHIQSYSGVEDKHFYPGRDGCYWGPDQLRSRLESLSSRPR